MLARSPTGTWLPAYVPKSTTLLSVLLLLCAAVESAVSRTRQGETLTLQTNGFDGSLLNGLKYVSDDLVQADMQCPPRLHGLLQAHCRNHRTEHGVGLHRQDPWPLGGRHPHGSAWSPTYHLLVFARVPHRHRHPDSCPEYCHVCRRSRGVGPGGVLGRSGFICIPH
jgi:hypothetical protein